ncbi:hypothetical protein [Aurantiacibacter sp. MUD61]|uniref:hypothetical protein n=1 Tax=Aurantiacibacter sp. MUD61 TaxID=3009083 RepID=UPI0022EFEC0F|nr:hypothetical protein [Aurantiacibacter sp. MUD61]
MRLLFPALAALLLAACNPVANMNEGEDRIADFQAAYSDGNSDALWAMVGPEFREVTSREEFDDLITVVSARLGPIESSEREGFNVNTNTGGTFTTVQMATQFEQGDGVEVYMFQGNGDDMRLVGWNVNSQRLMVTPEDIAGMAEQGDPEVVEINPVEPVREERRIAPTP